MTTIRALAIVAIATGALAAIAGSPYRADNAAIDVESIAQAIAAEQDHVTAIELAEWIRDRHPGLRVIDVGGADTPLPGAVYVPMAALATTASSFGLSDTVVVYSDAGAHGAQAWVLLRALGFRQVFFLQGGHAAWLADVMYPAISPEATAAERAAFARVEALSRYFGGETRIAKGAEIAALRRRGC